VERDIPSVVDRVMEGSGLALNRRCEIFVEFG